MMRNIILVLIIFMLAANMSCRRNHRKVYHVDFESTELATNRNSDKATRKVLQVAVSAILSPKETYDLYEELFRYISERLEMDIEFIQRKTYREINDMLENETLDFAFICSGAYVELNLDKGLEILAIPVSNNKPYYQAYIIVPKSSPVSAFEDLMHKSFAFTDPISNTGHLYVLNRLVELNRHTEEFFASTIFTHGHDISIQMVAKGLVDGATIDGLVFDYLEAKEPERVRDIKIIEKSAYFGIPPVVVTQKLNRETKLHLRKIFMQIHEDPISAEIIHSLLIDRFIEGKDEDYNSIRQMKSKLEVFAK